MSEQCGSGSGNHTCTLPKGHEGMHANHWSQWPDPADVEAGMRFPRDPEKARAHARAARGLPPESEPETVLEEPAKGQPVTLAETPKGKRRPK